MVKCCVVIGGGVAGPNAALALAKAGFQCTMYELRDSPSTIGGAINLTPNALRLLKDLGVNLSGCIVESIELFSIHTAQKLGEIPFHKPNGHSMRVLRTNLQTALLNAVSEAGIPIEYGSKLVKVDDQPESDKVTVGFADGKTADADLVLGCDGVHSAVRMQAVEPNRRPEYTGIATAYAIVAAEFIRSDVHFQQTAVNMSQRGSLLTSYIDADKTKIYLAAVMELEEQASKEGWKARGKDRDATLQEIRRRFGDSVLPCLPELVNSVSDFFFYPVFKLSPGGKWHTDRVLLIGDAAHAVCCLQFKPDSMSDVSTDASSRRKRRACSRRRYPLGSCCAGMP